MQNTWKLFSWAFFHILSEMFIKFREIKKNQNVIRRQSIYQMDFQKILVSKQFRLVDRIYWNSVVSVEKCLHIWSLIFPNPVWMILTFWVFAKGVLIRLYCVCSLLLSKRKDKYRSVRSKTLWETKHYHQQNQENLKFRGQLMLSRILFHFIGECAYEILILDLVIFIIFYEKPTPFLCKSKEIQVDC